MIRQFEYFAFALRMTSINPSSHKYLNCNGFKVQLTSKNVDSFVSKDQFSHKVVHFTWIQTWQEKKPVTKKQANVNFSSLNMSVSAEFRRRMLSMFKSHG